MLTFEAPAYLFLLALIPVFVFIRHFSPSREKSLRVSVGLWRGRSNPVSQRPLGIVLWISAMFFWGGVILLTAALSGPLLSRQEKVYLNKGSDIIIVLDQSPSMAARDFPPDTRLEAAVNMIKYFVSARKNDAVGLVGFGDEAILKVPPTWDYKAFISRLEESRIKELGEGTAIGMGLAVAVLHLSESQADDRFIVLVTDGDNNSGEIQPAAAASMAAQLGIRLYTIGIGTEGELPFEFLDPDSGSIISGKLDSRFNESLLRDLAQTGGGSFFRATTAGTLESVFRSIDSLETTGERIRIRVASIPLYRRFILIGLSLVLMHLFLGKILLRELI